MSSHLQNRSQRAARMVKLDAWQAVRKDTLGRWGRGQLSEEHPLRASSYHELSGDLRRGRRDPLSLRNAARVFEI